MTKQKKWFESISNSNKCNYCVLKEGDKKIGMVRIDEIDHINKNIRIGGDILEIYRNTGYGTSMIKLLLKYCFHYLNMHRV